jgi:hypothetical protein
LPRPAKSVDRFNRASLIALSPFNTTISLKDSKHTLTDSERSVIITAQVCQEQVYVKAKMAFVEYVICDEVIQ